MAAILAVRHGFLNPLQLISDAAEFGRWFGVRFDGPFAAGATLKGKITPTMADPEVAQRQKPHEGVTFQLRHRTNRTDAHLLLPMASLCRGAERRLLARPTTLVVFTLEEVGEGTMLTVTESGFDRISERRARAFANNEQGWETQTRLIEKYLAAAA